MSHSAICLAVRDQLQVTFSLDSSSCEVGFDGSTKPSAGQFYVAIHPLGLEGISNDFDLGESYSVGVTLSMRLGVAPKDRRGIAIWLDQADGTGLHQCVRQAITAIHQNQNVRIAANTHIAGGGGNIVTALLLMPGGVQPPQIRSYDWFSAVAPDGQSQVDDAGVSQTITFGKCQRVQDVPDMD